MHNTSPRVPGNRALSRRLRLTRHRGVRNATDIAGATIHTNQVADTPALLDQLILAGRDLLTQPVVNDEVVADFVVAIAIGAQRHRKVDALGDAVRVPVCAHARGEAVARRRGRDKRADCIGRRHRRRSRARLAPFLDERAAARRNRRRELLLEPLDVLDHIHRGLSANLGVEEIRHLRRGMVSPDGCARDAGVELASLDRHLALGTVLVEARKRMEVLTAQTRRILHRDERVGVTRVADHDNLAVLMCSLVEGAALH
mmetsp:Transcript_22983/g.68342  ORF Transcript_22983/g.68342 Transcript_22983/m.68342 type:complete len:258 (-) Transcript_22983:567-1340(-)